MTAYHCVLKLDGEGREENRRMMSLNRLPINLFDLTLAAVLLGGVLQGRRHGMSEELVNLLKWLVVVVVGSMIYEPVGRQLAASSPFSLLACFQMAYAGTALLILVVFALFKRSLGGKLVGSDIFGRTEYYLGMGAGLVRFSCIALVGLALLHARYFSPAEVRAAEKFQKDVYGSDFFPTYHTLQATVFERSMTGPWIKSYLGSMLIKPTAPEQKAFRQREYSLP